MSRQKTTALGRIAFIDSISIYVFNILTNMAYLKEQITQKQTKQ